MLVELGGFGNLLVTELAGVWPARDVVAPEVVEHGRAVDLEFLGEVSYAGAGKVLIDKFQDLFGFEPMLNLLEFDW